ncbi:MAG: hypothetical protein ACKVY0_13055 [Prosthecobacter sp.]|uniref:hypothetical protein n=1 Tax=Prosthecobacter sp. TaxID=1965333 RepID=UPI003902514A
MKSKRHRMPLPRGGTVFTCALWERRAPEFPIRREAVVPRCLAKERELLDAGVALALLDLMTEFHCCIKCLHELTGVARSMIHGILLMEKEPSTRIVARLAAAFGLQAIELYLLGFFTLRAEVSR